MKNRKVLRWYVVLAGAAVLAILVGIALPARRAQTSPEETSDTGKTETAAQTESGMDEEMDDTVRLFAGSEGTYPDFPSDIILNMNVWSFLEEENGMESIALWYAAGESLVVWLDDDYCTQIFDETDLEELDNEDGAEYLQAVNRLNTAFHQILEYVAGGEHPELAAKALAYYYHEDGTLGTRSNPTQAYLDGQAYLEEASGQ